MIAWLKIALRNVMKNRRRSVITALAIALGFAAVNLFGGFTVYMYNGNRQITIYGRAQGHLTVFKKGFLEAGKIDPARFLLSAEETAAITDICHNIPEIDLTTPQLRITGLVTNGEISTIFIAQGIVPSAAEKFVERATFLKLDRSKMIEGKPLQDDQMYGVAMARGLARLLDVGLEANVVAFTNTVYGQMNALDMEIYQMFDVDSPLLNDKAMRVPFRFAQNLMDTEGADRIAILLSKNEDTERIRGQLQAAFAAKGLEVEVKTWKELSEWYRKVKEMFDTIFLFLFTIVFIIILMSVVNTMGMAVLERTREIGTLRALGLKRRGIVLLFALESGLLGIIGNSAGAFLTILGWFLVDLLRPTWLPPGITSRVPIQVEFVPVFMVYSFIGLLTLCLVASLIPARRAAGQNVVEALGHV